MLNTKLYRKSSSPTLKSIFSGILSIKLHYVERPSDQNHIFVLGPPRSGTTLLHRILVSHSEICGPDDETFFFLRRRFDNLDINCFSNKLDRGLVDIRSTNKVRLFDSLASCVKGLHDKPIFAEKTPEHALRLPLLKQLFPRSKFIFLLRDPRDAYVSARRNKIYWSKIGHRYPLIWKACVAQYVKATPDDTIYMQKYEELVRDATSCVSKVMNFCGLNFEDQQLNNTNYGKTITSFQLGHERLREDITDKTVGEWKRVLEKSEIQLIEKKTKRLMELFGYE